jgi:hypothetical protein
MEMEEEGGKVKELEAQKLALIERYMKLQDEVDEMNERVYHVCCEIEALNLSIGIAQEEERQKKVKLKAQAGGNGNGKTHHPAPSPRLQT